MNVRAPVGDLNIALQDCCIGRGLTALRHNSGCTTYTLYQMQSLKKKLNEFNGEGTVFGSINQNDLKNVPIIQPNVSVIEAFTKLAKHFDDKVENNQHQIISLAQLRDTLLPKLISGELRIPDAERFSQGDGQPQGVAPTGLSLPDVVHRFKTMTTKRYADGVKNDAWPPFSGRVWQRNYYEHIINNPLQWALDRENPANVKQGEA